MANKNDVTEELKKAYPFIIKHYPSGKTLIFKAFLKDFSDSHKSGWSADTNAYSVGPTTIAQKSVTRSITVALDIPAFDVAEARENLKNMHYLAKFMYPTIRNGRIWTSTFMGVKFANWINYSKGLIGKALGGGGTDDGFLPVYVEDFTFKPNMEVGHFIESSTTAAVDAMIYPKLIELSLTFNVAALNAPATSFFQDEEASSSTKKPSSPDEEDSKGYWRNPGYPYFAAEPGATVEQLVRKGSELADTVVRNLSNAADVLKTQAFINKSLDIDEFFKAKKTTGGLRAMPRESKPATSIDYAELARLLFKDR